VELGCAAADVFGLEEVGVDFAADGMAISLKRV
jgi:hypothetical protein